MDFRHADSQPGSVAPFSRDQFEKMRSFFARRGYDVIMASQYRFRLRIVSGCLLL